MMHTDVESTEALNRATNERPPADVRSPIFIGGVHRSGTTLMRVMLHRHPHIACGPESQLLEHTGFRDFHEYMLRSWAPTLQLYGLHDRDIDEAMAAFLDNFFSRYASQRGKHRWGEKTPKNILRIDYLFRLFPNARFIHMIRDPRDVHCSVKEKAKTTTSRWSSITADRTARAWVRALDHGLPWRDDPARYLEVRYENLVQEPIRGMRRVLSFLNEPWNDSVLEAHAANPVFARGNVNQHVFTTSAERWKRDLSSDDLDAIEALAGPLMQDCGYPLSRDGKSVPHTSSARDPV
jgi:protein-tyrosine sulfotransferase